MGKKFQPLSQLTTQCWGKRQGSVLVLLCTLFLKYFDIHPFVVLLFYRGKTSPESPLSIKIRGRHKSFYYLQKSYELSSYKYDPFSRMSLT